MIRPDLKSQIEDKYVDKPTETPEIKEEKVEQTTEQPVQETVETSATETPTTEENKQTETIESPISSLKNESPKTTEAPQLSEEEITKLLDERIKKDGYIKSSGTGNEFVDWVLQKHNEGLDLTSDLVHNYTKSYDNYDLSNPNQAVELVKQDLISKGYSPEEASWQVKKDYNALFSEDYEVTDNEYKDAEMSLKIAARESKSRLDASRQELAIPKGGLQQKGISQEEFDQQVAQTINSQYNQISQDMGAYYNKNLKGYEKEGFSFGESQIDFKVTPEMEAQISEDFANYYSQLDRLSMNKDGQIDPLKLRKLLLLTRYSDDIFKALSGQLADSTKRDFIESEVKHTERSNDKPQAIKTDKPNVKDYNNARDFLQAQLEYRAKQKQN